MSGKEILTFICIYPFVWLLVYFLVQKFRMFLFWLVLDSNVKLGRLAPWIFGLAVGRMPRKKVDPEEEEDEQK